MDNNYKIGIVGPGNVGSALAYALADQGRLGWVVARSQAARSNITGITNAAIYNSIDEIESLPEMIALAVSDSAIAAADEQIARKFLGRLAGKYIFHCSGSKRASELKHCTEAGARCASLHPYQTFYESGAAALRGIAWGTDCRDEDFPTFAGFAESLGGRALLLSDQTLGRKTLYHASAVAASNFMTAIIQLSKEMAALSGIDPQQFQPPIIKTTLANNMKSIDHPDEFPLTGPVERGDADTLAAHAESLAEDERLLAAYCHMSLAAAELARHRNKIDREKYEKIIRVLSAYI